MTRPFTAGGSSRIAIMSLSSAESNSSPESSGLHLAIRLRRIESTPALQDAAHFHMISDRLLRFFKAHAEPNLDQVWAIGTAGRGCVGGRHVRDLRENVELRAKVVRVHTNSLEPESHVVVRIEGRRLRDQHDLNRSIVTGTTGSSPACGDLFKVVEQTLSVRRAERPKQIDAPRRRCPIKAKAHRPESSP